MSKKKVVAFLSVVILCAVATFIYSNISKLRHKHLDPKIVAFYDKPTKHAWIFRGNTPTRNISFEYNKLIKILRERAKAADYPLPDSFRLVDISLLRNDWPLYEKIQVRTEKAYFDSHKKSGLFLNNPIHLIGEKPTDHYNYQEVERAVNLLHNSVLKANEPTVFYLHCEDGKSRTGVVLAKYSVKYESLSVNQAIEKVSRVLPVKDNVRRTILHDGEVNNQQK